MSFSRRTLTALAALALGACQTEAADIDPAATADKPDPDAVETGTYDSAIDEVRGLKVIVETDAWRGASDVPREVTPLRVTLKNGGDELVRVRYRDFFITDGTGESYSALPPFQVSGEVDRPVLVETYEPVEPTWNASEFVVVKHYEPLYPEHSSFTGYITYDPQYYKYYFARWKDGEMPTAEMLASALPEGHLLPGGDITGFVFFEKIPAEYAKLTFNANLVNSSTGELFGFVTIPLRAEPPVGERPTPD